MTDSKGVPIPDNGVTLDTSDGKWEQEIKRLSVAAHSFTGRALYGSRPESAARTLTIVPVVVPTLDNVLDRHNEEVPEGTSTVSTTLQFKGKASRD
ncbi:hypothetical protein K5E40_31365 [Pseudomonas baetica]|uniref:hypothetical protein n=1 Tax=Pseudomonas baetica TaxID=674054 RepID=UPI001C8BD93E|nr:hypothetical protein [Pseudomonas baetica]MBX9410146.1 hypothetical protein [Pseudomonas baetica]